MPSGPGQVAGDAHDVLAVLVGQRLAHRGLGTGLPGPRRRPTPSAVAAAGGSRPRPRRRPGGRAWRRRAHPRQPGSASTRSSAVGPIPHSAPSPTSETRSLPRVTLASSQPPCSGPTRWSAGIRTSLKKTSLKAWSPVMSMRGRISMPGRVHRADEVGDAHVLGRRRVGAGQQDAPAGDVGVAGPDLLAVDDPLVAVALGPGGERGQVGAGTRLAEELAPDLLARRAGARGSAPSAPRCRRT